MRFASPKVRHIRVRIAFPRLRVRDNRPHFCRDFCVAAATHVRFGRWK